ncbi:hypothetical protein [uncultured Thiodictyon sp.]|uniref:hypothetical protein n=1 Tax=uncultured Thiodictyon sp. TaxID=1846217 RepID=UPI0025DC6ED0|nr:hypothetical protein [uncultured Thiodictyon sp.]
MKLLGKTARRLAVLAAASAAAFIGGCATAEQNMAAQQKQHLIPGKQIQATGPNYQFCELGLFYGTSMENAVADFYNPTGIDHCTPEQFAQLEKAKAQIIKDNGARDAWLNPTRYWTWDEFWVYEVGDVRQFGPVKMAYMGVVPVEVMKKAVGAGHYHPGPISRNNKYLFKKGTRVYLLDLPDGKVLVMQSWTNFTNKGETAANLKDLASQFKQVPPGWKFRSVVLEQDLVLTPEKDGTAHITQDNFGNTCDHAGAPTATSSHRAGY